MIPLRLAAYGAAAALVVATYHFTPLVGPHARLERLEAKRAAWEQSSASWQAAAGGWQKSFRKAERLRAEERVQALAAVNDTALQCDARVKQARTSAKVIREILDRPVKVKDGCPVRGVLGAGDLGRALGAR